MLISLLSCTNKKSFEAQTLLMRNYRDDIYTSYLSEIAQRWRADMELERPKFAIRDLYSGSWSIAREGIDQCLLPHTMLVVSAGLGLVGLDEKYPAYSSTFSDGQPDSIPKADDLEIAREWWEHLGGPSRLWREVERTASPRMVVAVPKNYLLIIQPHLEQFIERYGAHRLSVIISTTNAQDFPSLKCSQVIVDSRMTGFKLVDPPKGLKGLGGTVGEITVSAWRHFVQTLSREEDFAPEALNGALQVFAPFLACELKANGRSLSGEELESWIREQLTGSQPPTSATAALRMLRREGYACEQKKFGQLFRQIQTEVGYSGLFG